MLCTQFAINTSDLNELCVEAEGACVVVVHCSTLVVPAILLVVDVVIAYQQVPWCRMSYCIVCVCVHLHRTKHSSEAHAAYCTQGRGI
jgi:hypothetical protein